ncbi:UNVERIFIED_CONTAM: Disease resistance protein RPS5 [Sesamum radiatum]|uniref:Disease resistance protein RPS5 n=1 Tax=Sesamum radiatum TaxID=300843 RepID=A0AAW2RZA9_SESRA
MFRLNSGAKAHRQHRALQQGLVQGSPATDPLRVDWSIHPASGDDLVDSHNSSTLLSAILHSARSSKQNAEAVLMAEMLSNMAEKLANLAAEMLLDYTGVEEKMETLRNDIQVLENRAADVLAVIEEEEICNVCKTKGKPLVTTEWKSQRSLKQNLKTVWAWLMNDVDSRIGIYGMGGVGKTTLAMHIHNKLLNDPKFKGRVYWINVSQDSNIHKLQHDIASVINLDLSSEDNENQRAAELFAALRKRRSFAFILDNVWNNFDIEKIGIPLGRDGSKLLITTRSVDVCHKMGCQKIIKVNVLNEEEAWELFLEKLGSGIKLPSDTEDIAKEVAKRCAGLPLGIITMGGSMRGVIDIHEWRDALEELKESSMGPDDMENKVFPLLLCSFIRLRDPKLQRCFLYCCLYPEESRIPREELISKFISEGLMDRRNSRQASFDQGHSILNRLENASLLERADSKYVRMHDLIRDMALRIARNDAGFMVKAGLQLHVIPEEQEWEEDLDKISLMCNKISDMTHCISPNCPRLSTLILRRNPLEKIPDAFFVRMRGLKVLDLSYTWIEELPNSLSDLENLNALLLTCCVELKYVPPLTKLKELKELDLNKNKLKELPQGMENLVNLKSLNIGSMSCMEMMLAGAYDAWSRSHPDSKRLTDKLLTIKGYCFKRGRGGEKVLLPQDIQDLKIVRCDGVSSCFSDIFPSLNSLRSLKSFRISHCTEIECISTLCTSSYLMEEKQDSCCFLFQSLEYLILSWLPNLTSLIWWDVRAAVPPTGTFSHLKKLRIEFCNKIRKLFTLRMLQNLYSLEEVYVSECAGMEEIIGEDDGCELESNNRSCYSASVSSIYNDQAILTLPKLRALSLKWLPELRSICREMVVCDSIETIGMFQCHKIKRLPFFMPQLNGQPSPPPTLKQIRIGKDDRDWWESLEWSHSNMKNMLLPFVKYLELGFQKGLIKPDWSKLVLACLFIRRLQVQSRS